MTRRRYGRRYIFGYFDDRTKILAFSRSDQHALQWATKPLIPALMRAGRNAFVALLLFKNRKKITLTFNI